MRQLNTNNINIRSISERFLLALFILMFPLVGTAAIDINTMVTNLANNITPVIYLTTAISFILGFWFVISSIIELKKIGQSQSSAASESVIGGPIMRLFIGIALIYLPSTIDITTSTLWGGSSLQAYTPAAGDRLAIVKSSALVLIRAVGYVSFIRGFVILSHSTKQGAQQGTVGKGFLHIIGGILAINVWPTLEVIRASLGISSW